MEQRGCTILCTYVQQSVVIKCSCDESSPKSTCSNLTAGEGDPPAKPVAFIYASVLTAVSGL